MTMDKTISVEIEKIERMLLFRDLIERVPLKDIAFTRGGKPVEIDEELIRDWQFIGLSNLDFIATGYYLGGEVKNK